MPREQVCLLCVKAARENLGKSGKTRVYQWKASERWREKKLATIEHVEQDFSRLIFFFQIGVWRMKLLSCQCRQWWKQTTPLLPSFEYRKHIFPAKKQSPVNSCVSDVEDLTCARIRCNVTFDGNVARSHCFNVHFVLNVVKESLTGWGT